MANSKNSLINYICHVSLLVSVLEILDRFRINSARQIYIKFRQAILIMGQFDAY